MLKKISLKISVLAMISVMLVTNSLAQTTTRIRFARGRSSATYSGTIPPGTGKRKYVLRAMSGQTLTATLSSGNGRCDFTQGDYEDTQYTQEIERTGDIYFSIDNHGNRTTTYTLTVSVR